jgi:flagellar hook-associated protein 1 FlgK
MGGLSTSLLIGEQALAASQGALNDTSNNIANADTAGYTREVAEFSENSESLDDGEVTGGGVTLTGLQSVRDELLNMQVNQQTSAQSSVDTQYSSLEQVQNYFTTTGTDIASTLSDFSSSLTDLSSSPSDTSVQQSVVDDGQNLANAFNTTANGLTTVQSDADTQVTQTVSQINTLTTQIAQLNGQVQQLTASGQDGGTVEDQRDENVQQLSKLTGISVTQNSEGVDTITTGNGSALVSGSQSYALTTQTGSDGFQQVIDSSGNNITSSISGGTLGGAIEIRDTTIPSYLSTLNTLATQFASAFNSAQAEGYTSSGSTGGDFFTISDSTNAAATISVSNSAEVAPSSDGSSGSNGNVANLSAALTTALPSGQTASATYASLVDQVGNDTSNADTESTAIGDNLTQLTNQQSSVSGVSTDEETTNLIKYQTAYEAAARIVSTVQALTTVTLDMGSDQSY